ncbi:MAG: patatin-like phospholipase family protein [Clostridium sp.]
MKIGLVLSGGGGKGAYELGVWKALTELELDKYINVFSGTSIGAFNAVLFAQGDMELCDMLWDEVTMEKLVPISKFELFKKGVGLFIGGKNPTLAKKIMVDKVEEGAVNKEGAIDIINKYLDFSKMKENSKTCYVACTQMPDYNAKYFRLNEYDNELCRDMVLASASLPLIYDSTEVLGVKYIDGGIVDNTPIQPVYGENCDIIIVVYLSKDSKIDRTLYPNTQIIEIKPQNLDESVLDGTLNLDDIAKKRRIREGYDDTINMMRPICSLVNLVKEENLKCNHPIIYRIHKWFKVKY